MMALSSFLAPPLPFLSSLRQPQIHPRCSSHCPSSLTAALPPPSGSPRCNSCRRCRRCRRRPSLPILCCSLNSRAAYASEEERKKKLLESYGLDPSDFLSRSANEPRRRRRDQRDEVGKGKHVPLFQESKPPLRTTHKLLKGFTKDFKSEGFSGRSSPIYAKLVSWLLEARKKDNEGSSRRNERHYPLLHSFGEIVIGL